MPSPGGPTASAWQAGTAPRRQWPQWPSNSMFPLFASPRAPGTISPSTSDSIGETLARTFGPFGTPWSVESITGRSMAVSFSTMSLLASMPSWCASPVTEPPSSAPRRLCCPSSSAVPPNLSISSSMHLMEPRSTVRSSSWQRTTDTCSSRRSISLSARAWTPGSLASLPSLPSLLACGPLDPANSSITLTRDSVPRSSSLLRPSRCDRGRRTSTPVWTASPLSSTPRLPCAFTLAVCACWYRRVRRRLDSRVDGSACPYRTFCGRGRRRRFGRSVG